MRHNNPEAKDGIPAVPVLNRLDDPRPLYTGIVREPPDVKGIQKRTRRGIYAYFATVGLGLAFFTADTILSCNRKRKR